LGLRRRRRSSSADRFWKRAMNDTVVVLGLLAASLINVACLCGLL
jgi:hypothetical protein